MRVRKQRRRTKLGAMWKYVRPAAQCSKWELMLLHIRKYGKPSEQLWAEVLIDAIRVLLGTRKAAVYGGPRPMREAASWLRDRKAVYLGAFNTTCDILGLDVEVVRDDLLRRAGLLREAA